jgi:hypothetical protein
MPPKGSHFNLSDEAKAKIRAALTGRKHSAETIEKIRLGNLGKKRTPEMVENNRRAHIGLPSARKGAHHTEEAKQKLRDARARQTHPSFVANGITPEMVAEAGKRGMRWCGGCKAFLFNQEFYIANHRYCKLCAGVSNREHRATWTEEQNAEYRARVSEYRITNAANIRRNWMLKRYGVTPEWYDAKLAEQDGHCALCSATTDGRRLQPKAIVQERKYLLVDHNHETGLARGLLCAKCNTALARVEYIQDWATKALAYLACYATSEVTY